MPTQLKFQDIMVPSPGFGCMSFSQSYGPADDEESLQVLKTVLASGCKFLDTASVYGFGHNESLIGRFLKENNVPRDALFIGSKCGFDTKENRGVTNKASHINEFIDGTIERLGRTPDLYYLHRIDPDTPLEESITALDGLKKAGKCKYIGLSEPSAQTLRKACKIAHIDALQIEYSPFFLDHETDDLIDAARELGVTIVAYSPLGKGMLTGKYRDPSKFAGDIRGTIPRYSQEHFDSNIKLVDEFERLAKVKGCKAGQLAIAWVAAQGAIPIPGTKNKGRFEENWGASEITLSEQELKDIRKVLDEVKVAGARYGEAHLKMVGR